ncbi:hypothetical protein F8B43_0832 [Methylorubrum populi]|uniref:Uncharacterized protein n=1 Tax=Methylorubrum populi TaxID=223967 RepID=A0A833JAS9_9HYPH|nr:hypothetical protein F8B43_0832 [Methylorubrum populi]
MEEMSVRFGIERLESSSRALALAHRRCRGGAKGAQALG